MPTSDGLSPIAKQHLKQARAELATVKANLCGHGIDRTRGKCADCDKTKTDPKPAPTEETNHA